MIAVVTVVRARHDHLRAQRAGLARCTPRPDLHVVVAMGDPDVAGVVAATDLPTRVLHVPVGPAGLPLAAARNAGADAALAARATLLVFLDVDCVPAPDLLAGYLAGSAARPDALLCGAVTYLPPAPPGGWTDGLPARAPHPARPDPAAGTMLGGVPELFWSLSFAVTADTWRRLDGGFHEGYVGYGGEDTDLAVSAAARDVATVFVGGADAFHLHHPVSDPPVEHLDDILRNGAVFAARHGRWPMQGWLEALPGVERDGTRWRRTQPLRVVTVPDEHPYVDAVVPPTVERALRSRVRLWQPDPLLEPDRLAAAADAIDVVHLHFGYDHVDPDVLRAWLRTARENGIGVVATVHDLRNPHHAARARHDAHLQALADSGAALLTLTSAAADEFARRFGRRPDVVAHPTLVADVPAPVDGPPLVVVPAKAMRRNVHQLPELVAAVVRGAGDAEVRLLLEPSALEHPDVRRACAEVPGVGLDVRPYLGEDELHALVGRASVWVLPYRFGTHSGWVELCRDLGTTVVAPSCGHFAAQDPDVVVYRNDECDGLDPLSLQDAVCTALARPPRSPARRRDRLAQRDAVRAVHDAVYRAAARR